MRKYAYLARLEELLAELPAQDRQEALNYYEEYFDAAGTENEEKTAAELGDPVDVARKILEEEGSTPQETASAAPVQATDVMPPQAEAAPEPAPAAAAPAGPEPPALDDPENYPASGTGAVKAVPKPHTKRLWLVFWLLVALALVIQLAVLVLGLGQNWGGESAFAAAEYAASLQVEETAPVAQSEPVVEEGPVQSAPVDTGTTDLGQVSYSTALQTQGRNTLNVHMYCGNVAFRTGEEAGIQVNNVEDSRLIHFTEDGRADTFVCESSDPDAHVTITLPANAYDEINVVTSGSGAIELGDLQAETITAVTADGPIQSGWVRAGTLILQTNRGNIWLEKATDGTGYQLENVKLLAPEGYVSADLDGPISCWTTRITNAEGYSKTTEATDHSGILRDLEVQAGSTIDIQYDA